MAQTPQDIKNGMTQGEWEIHEFLPPSPTSILKIYVRTSEKKVCEVVTNNKKIDALAITKAVNATWNLGYDPAVMDDLYKCLDNMVKLYRTPVSHEEEENILNNAHYALTKAKIN